MEEAIEIEIKVDELINNELKKVLIIFDKIDNLNLPTLYKITIKLKWFLFLLNYLFCGRCSLNINEEENLSEFRKKCFLSKNYDICQSISKLKKILNFPSKITDEEIKEINAIIDIPHFGFWIYVPFNKAISSYIKEYIDYKLQEIGEIQKSIESIDKNSKKIFYDGLEVLLSLDTDTKHLKEYITYYDFYSKLVMQLSLKMEELKISGKKNKRVELLLIDRDEEMLFELKDNNYKSLCSRLLYKLETGDYIENNRSKKHIEKINKVEKIIKAIPYM